MSADNSTQESVYSLGDVTCYKIPDADVIRVAQIHFYDNAAQCEVIDWANVNRASFSAMYIAVVILGNRCHINMNDNVLATWKAAFHHRGR